MGGIRAAEILPGPCFAQHIGVVGKTGSGKTITAKLLIEQIVALRQERVCILDPIKSDYWGLTSSADGKHPGLPFHILGGPHGHVPLHHQAGAAIAEVVASVALPLSILDMADFGPGGQNRFFIDFVATLMRRTKGVLYLVLEEAHLFAPKERAGLGDENMAIHWAKMLATAGRSKGIRLIVVTQRTQALHNAVLGACETMILHRLVAPADKKAPMEWVNDNVTVEYAKEVKATLSKLRNGDGWVLSGEAQIFERRQFPMIQTFDNTSTPMGDDETRSIKTAPVDLDKLRSIVGTAVEEAKANDPKELKKRIAELEAQLKRGKMEPTQVDPLLIEAIKRDERLRARAVLSDIDSEVHSTISLVESLTLELQEKVGGRLHSLRNTIGNTVDAEDRIRPIPDVRIKAVTPVGGYIDDTDDEPVPYDGTAELSKLERSLLTALAQYPEGLEKGTICLIADYRPSGDVSSAFARFTEEKWMECASGLWRITPAGVKALGTFRRLPTGDALRESLLNGSNLSPLDRALLRQICEHYPKVVSKTDIVQMAGYKPSGDVSSAFAKFTRIGWITTGREGVRASDRLFGR